MKGLHVVLALMLLTGTASAQAINLLKGDGAPKTMDDIQKEREVEEAYKKQDEANSGSKGDDRSLGQCARRRGAEKEQPDGTQTEFAIDSQLNSV